MTRFQIRLAGSHFRVDTILHNFAVHMPDGELEVCYFCKPRNGRPKVVFDDLTNARRAAGQLSSLGSAQNRLYVHPCRMWSGVWHLTSQRQE
jgi:hypothetical protein